MHITAEMSLYPLHEDFIADIDGFLAELNRQSGIQVITNRMSTQVRGPYAAVTGAINRAMERTMQQSRHMVLVVKYINADLPIDTPTVPVGAA